MLTRDMDALPIQSVVADKQVAIRVIGANRGVITSELQGFDACLPGMHVAVSRDGEYVFWIATEASCDDLDTVHDTVQHSGNTYYVECHYRNR